MSNLLDYIKWRGDLSFKKDKFNIIDAVIFSQLSMIDFLDIIPDYPSKESITIKEAKEKYFSESSCKTRKIGLIIPDAIFDMFALLANTKRYSNLLLSNYINIVDEEKQLQISALTIQLDNEVHCISFSGTDDTIIGWKENIDMIFKSPVPSQIKAVEYVNKINEIYNNKLYICGHSKGGNMSLYSGTYANAEVLINIEKIFNFDGPGVSKALCSDLDGSTTLGKTITIIPQSSTVGRLFEHREKYMIVKSLEKGLFQHDVFSWQIEGKDFIYENELTKESKEIDIKIKEVLDSMTEEEKIGFSDSLYTLLSRTDAKNLIELSTRKKEIIKSYIKLTKDERKFISNPIKKLLKDKAAQKFLFGGLIEFGKKKMQE